MAIELLKPDLIGPAGEAWLLTLSQSDGDIAICSALLSIPGVSLEGERFLLVYRMLDVNPMCPTKYEFCMFLFPSIEGRMPKWIEPKSSRTKLAKQKKLNSYDNGLYGPIVMRKEFMDANKEDLFMVFTLVVKTFVNGFLLPVQRYQPEMELMCERWISQITSERLHQTYSKTSSLL